MTMAHMYTCKWDGVEKTLCLRAWAELVCLSVTFINKQLKIAEDKGFMWNERMAFAIKQKPSTRANTNPTGKNNKVRVNKDVNHLAQSFAMRGLRVY